MSAADERLRDLAPDARKRLDGFATLFDRLDASQYATLTQRSPGAEIEVAQRNAMHLVGTSGRQRDAVRQAIRVFTDAAQLAYASRLSIQAPLLAGSLPDRAEDRHRFLESVERVVVALVLWDELDDADRAALVGLWSPLVEPLVNA